MSRWSVCPRRWGSSGFLSWEYKSESHGSINWYRSVSSQVEVQFFSHKNASAASHSRIINNSTRKYQMHPRFYECKWPHWSQGEYSHVFKLDTCISKGRITAPAINIYVCSTAQPQKCIHKTDCNARSWQYRLVHRISMGGASFLCSFENPSLHHFNKAATVISATLANSTHKK